MRLRGRLPRSAAARVALALVAILAALNLVGVVLDAIAPSPSGPRSSSLATSREGMAAWADLLRGRGRDVRALRERVSEARFPAGATVVVLDPDRLLGTEARALRRHAQGGGRVVAGGREPGLWLRVLLGEEGRVAWSPEGEPAPAPVVPLPETLAVRQVRTAGEGSFREAGAALPLLAGRERPVAVLARVGRGRVVALADPSPLQNRLLGAADNAALALALAPAGAPVLFVESVHGYGAGRGLGALPPEVQAALLGLGLAALALIAARGRRLGPPEAPRRALAPARRAYVDALGATLARTRRPEAAAEPVRRAARERLARRAGLPEDADDVRVVAAARALGLPEDEAGALLAPPRSAPEVLAAGRALARLEGRPPA